jgi:hypothetical protein
MGRESRRASRRAIEARHIRLEVFRYNVPGVGEVVWDITLAKQCVELPGGVLTVVDIPLDEMARIVARNTHDPTRLPHVDPSHPGIAAPLVFDGRVAYVLIDGQHRCARALQEGIVFKAQLLADAAARLCMLDCPPSLSPF